MKNKRRKLIAYVAKTPEKNCYRDTRLSWFTERELTQNIQQHIWDRESGLNRYNRRGCIPAQAASNEFYKSITPRLTVLGAANNLGSVRRFTPDGKHLISFIPGGIRVTEYSSVRNVQNLLRNVKGECIRSSIQTGLNLTYNLFPRFYDLPIIPDTMRDMALNRDFSMFVGNRYVVLCAKGRKLFRTFDRNSYLFFPDANDDCDRYQLYFFLIDLEEHCLCDEYEANDSSSLSHNYGMSVYGNMMAILSLSRQAIQVVEVVDSKFECHYQINMHEQSVRRYLLADSSNTNGAVEPPVRGMLSPIKQQIFAYLYKEAIASHPRSRRKRVLEFYKNVPNLEEMQMFRIQLLNADTIFIRFQCPSTDRDGFVTYSNTDDEVTGFKLFVFYSLSERKIIKIYPHDSVELLNLQRDFYDSFRPDRSWFSGMPASSPSNNPYFKLCFSRAVSQARSRKYAALSLNASLPFNTQGVSCSPYFNYNMFGYDDRWISSLQVPKLIISKPIAFEERLTGLYKFRIHVDTSRYNAYGARNKEKIVTFIAHPYEPFIISAQHIGNRLSLNYHLYCETTVVDHGKRQRKNEIWESPFKHVHKQRI